MSVLRRLAAAAVAVALGTVMLGSWTRIKGAGMTCPDWPLCRGMLVPSMADGTAWEWLHRLFAFGVSPLVLAMMVAAWRLHARSRFISPTLATVAVLFVVQVLLGAVTVHLTNSPFSVVLHWGTAMAFIASLCAMLIFASEAEAREPRLPAPHGLALAGVLGGTMLAAFVTMCVGAYVSSSGAGLACLSLPGCAGTVVVFDSGQYVQMLHRFTAGATLLLSVCSCALCWVRAATPRVRAAATIGVALVFVQVLLGLLNVGFRLPVDLREAHAFNASLVFLSFIAATLFAILDARQPALERATPP
jgi:heme A synthase